MIDYSKYIGKYCIIRSRDQGVMAGFVEGIDPPSIQLSQARQLYRWSSLFVLVELASYGPRRDSEQRYSAPSAEPVLVFSACGVLPCSETAATKIQECNAEEHQ
jgi:hypothetical protein